MERRTKRRTERKTDRRMERRTERSRRNAPGLQDEEPKLSGENKCQIV